MKKLIAFCLFIGVLALFVSCSSTEFYDIKTKDGTEYTCEGEPEFDDDTQAYTFIDLDGKEWTINREEIVTIDKKMSD